MTTPESVVLVQGTLYPDVVSPAAAPNATIKSHHNVGGLPDDVEFTLVEPLRLLFRTRSGPSAANSVCPRRSSAATRSRPGAGDPHRRRGGQTAARHPARGGCDRAEEMTAAGLDSTCGSARSCSWPTCARWECRATAAPTGTRSFCGR